MLDASQIYALWYVGGMISGAPEMVQGTAKAIYKDVQSVRLDSKLLQAAHPDIYAECSKKNRLQAFQCGIRGCNK